MNYILTNFLFVGSIILQWYLQGQIQTYFQQYSEKLILNYPKNKYYMTSGDILSLVLLGGTVLFLLFLHYQPVLQIFDMFLYHHPPPFFNDKVFDRNMVSVYWNFFLTTHDKYRTNFLILLIVLGSYISWSFPFIFYSMNPFGGS